MNIENLRYDDHGLIPCIVTDVQSKTVLMFAFMNEESLTLSVEKKEAVFFSRSRNTLWHKGESSGNFLVIHTMKTDCDNDCIWIEVEVQGNGVACHTGAKSCFFHELL